MINIKDNVRFRLHFFRHVSWPMCADKEAGKHVSHQQLPYFVTTQISSPNGMTESAKIFGAPILPQALLSFWKIAIVDCIIGVDVFRRNQYNGY